MTNIVMRRWLNALLLLILTAGCSQLPASKEGQSTNVEQTPDPAPKITCLTETAADLRQMSPADVKNQAAALETAYAQDKSETSRIRLAVWLALAPAPVGDRSRAYTLLNIAPGPDQLGRNHPVAQVLLPSLQEIIALHDAQTKNLAKLREEQKRGDGLQEKITALQKKINALSNVEKQMLERTPSKAHR